MSAATNHRIIVLLFVFLPITGFLTAVTLGWMLGGISALDLALCAGMYLLTAIGITAGFHRFFVHRSFQTSNFCKLILGALGSMAGQGPLFYWASSHRVHHQHSDGMDDPHSPNANGGGVRGTIKGFWHAHVGWMFKHQPVSWMKVIPDLVRDRTCYRVNKFYLGWLLIGFALPVAIRSAISFSWWGIVLAILWGGLVRMFLVHHVTWSVNSICHLFGRRTYDTDDDSRNNFLFGILALGEGWHNNHHASPSSARHGFRPWQIDLTFYLLKLLEWLGVVWHLKSPAPPVSRVDAEPPPANANSLGA
jgi:stearoyl-CoA desaturase (Delta-9 desaturase)